jgi:hypothetical protein
MVNHVNLLPQIIKTYLKLPLSFPHQANGSLIFKGADAPEK